MTDRHARRLASLLPVLVLIGACVGDPRYPEATTPDTIYVPATPPTISTTTLTASTERAQGVVVDPTTTTVPPSPVPTRSTVRAVPQPRRTPAPAAGRCTQYEGLLATYAPAGGWDVARMSRYMHRESNCQPGVRSRTRDTGLLQLNDVNLPYLSRVFGVQVTVELLKNPAVNIRAAAALCTYWRQAGSSCYRPWAT